MDQRPRVAIVGHSNVPTHFSHPGVEVRIFRKPGAWITQFDTYAEFRNLFHWPHDLCFLWLGSNDIYTGCGTQSIATQIIQLARRIEDQVGSTVVVVLIEPRNCPDDYQITTEEYTLVARGINRQINRARPGVGRRIGFWGEAAQHLDHTGWHFNDIGKQLVKDRFAEFIDQFFQ